MKRFFVRLFAPFAAVVRFLLRQLSLPDLRFHTCRKLTSEDGALVWWHVPVSLRHRWLRGFPLNNLTTTLTINRPMQKSLAMCWISEYSRVPTYRASLSGNEVLHIPIAARALSAGTALAYENPVISDNNTPENWLLKGGVPRITDENHFFTYMDLTDLPSPRDYRLVLQVKAGKRSLGGKEYVLHVPDKGKKNGLFTLEEI